jgi:hypothetical protein
LDIPLSIPLGFASPSTIMWLYHSISPRLRGSE